VDLLKAARDILGPLAYEVLELTVSGQGERRRLLLRIDRLDEAVVSMDDVTLATQVFGLELDRLDPFEGAYQLEVESPGAERPLFTKRHFERFIDLQAKVRSGQDSFKGIIRQVSDDEVSFEVDKHLRTYPLADIQARLAEWPSTPR
jgi:ribosome maturation factor RimP